MMENQLKRNLNKGKVNKMKYLLFVFAFVIGLSFFSNANTEDENCCKKNKMECKQDQKCSMEHNSVVCMDDSTKSDMKCKKDGEMKMDCCKKDDDKKMDCCKGSDEKKECKHSDKEDESEDSSK